MRCTASLCFDRAPYLDVQCSRAEHRDTEDHETVIRVPTRRVGDPMEFLTGRPSVEVALRWRTGEPA